MGEVTLERLQQIPLTKKLTDEEAQNLQSRVQELSLAAGDILFHQGEAAAFVYYVEKGKVVEVEVDDLGRQTVHRHAGQGEYLGRYALVTGRPSRVSAAAEEDTVLLAIPLRSLTPLLFSHPDWRTWFFRTDIAARLRAVPLFIKFDDWDIYRLADQVTVQKYDAEDAIFHPGDQADTFYIVDQGQVVESLPPNVRLPGTWPRYFAAGNFFGRHGLIHGKKRRVMAVAEKPTRLLHIPGQIIKELLAERTDDLPVEMARRKLLARLRGVDLFSGLSDEHLKMLTGYVSLEFRRPGDIVARQGEPASSLMILDEGEAVVRLQVGSGRPRPVSYFQASPSQTASSVQTGKVETTYFGDHALLADEMRGATVEVTQPSAWIVLERSDFERFLEDTGLTPEDLEQAVRPGEEVSVPVRMEDDRLPLPYLVRRHWIVPVSRIMPLAIAIIVVVILIGADVTLNLNATIRDALLVIGLFFLTLLGLWTVWRYVDWQDDTYEVTNEAVIHIERRLFFSEERYEAPLRQIQNVNIGVSVLGRLLGFGNVGIDTAAATGQVRFTTIPEPAFVQELIQKAATQARSGERIQFQQSIRQQLEDQLFPERLEPSAPESVLIQPEPPAASPPRFARFRALGGWLPRSEIRERDRVIWRKHWINLLQRTWLADLAALATTYLVFAYILAFVSRAFGVSRMIALPPVSWFEFQGWLFLVIGILWIPSILWFIYRYVDWRNDVYIVTNNEVIDVTRELAMFPFWFFYTESRKQASLANVQYVDFKIPHPIAMLFGYGDVIVRTAGAEGTLTFLLVSNPSRVHAEVQHRLTMYQERQRQQEFEERWGDMAEWFETYRTLVEQENSRPGSKL